MQWLSGNSGGIIGVLTILLIVVFLRSYPNFLIWNEGLAVSAIESHIDSLLKSDPLERKVVVVSIGACRVKDKLNCVTPLDSLTDLRARRYMNALLRARLRDTYREVDTVQSLFSDQSFELINTVAKGTGPQKLGLMFVLASPMWKQPDGSRAVQVSTVRAEYDCRDCELILNVVELVLLGEKRSVSIQKRTIANEGVVIIPEITTR